MTRALLMVVFAITALAACSDDSTEPTGRWPCPAGWVAGEVGGCGPAVLLCVPDGGAAPGACNGVDITHPGTIALPDGGTVRGFYRLSDGGIGGAWPEPGDPAVGIRTCPDGWSRSPDGTCDPQLRTDCPEGSEPLPCGRCTPTSERDCPTTEYADVGAEAVGAEVLHVRAGADPALADGSEAHPYPTIRDAQDHMHDEVWLLVARGEYAEQVEVSGGTVHLVGVCAARVTLRGNGTQAGARVDGSRALLDLRGVTVTGFDVGLLSLAGTLRAKAVGVVGNSGFGAGASGRSAHVELEGCIVSDTRPGRNPGIGLGAEGGASLRATGVFVAGNRAFGLFATGAGTRAELEGVVVRDTRPQANGTAGQGLIGQMGAFVHATGALVAGNSRSGVLAQNPGTRVEIDGSIVRDTQPLFDGSDGEGLVALDGASLHATGMLVTGNWTGGVAAIGTGTRIDLEGSIVRDTRPRRDGNDGEGLVAFNGASVHATSVLVTGNTSSGVVAKDMGSRVELEGSIVRDTRSYQNQMGIGLEARTGGFLHATRVLVTGNTGGGVVAAGMGVRIELEGCAVRDMRPRPTGTFGRGATAEEGAFLHATGVLISHNAEMGMTVLTADSDLTDVIVEDIAPTRRGLGVGLYVAEATVRGRRVAIQQVSGAGVAAVPAPAEFRGTPSHVYLEDVFVRDVHSSTIRFSEDNHTFTPEGAMVAYGLHAAGGASLDVTRALVDGGTHGVANVGGTIRVDTGVIAHQSTTASLFSDRPPALVNVAYRANRALSVNDPRALAAASLPPSTSICESGMCP